MCLKKHYHHGDGSNLYRPGWLQGGKVSVENEEQGSIHYSQCENNFTGLDKLSTIGHFVVSNTLVSTFAEEM